LRGTVFDGRRAIDVVRTPVEPTAHPRRRLEERILLRFPGLVDLLGRLIWRLPASARLTRALERHFLRIAWEAFNRGDLEASFIAYHADCECIWDPRWPSIGLAAPTGGKEDRIRAQRQIHSEWRELRFTPKEVIQFGDRLVSIGRMRGIGLASGVEVETDWVADFTIRDGRAIREQISVDLAEGLAAAGLPDRSRAEHASVPA
jgi:ketosteroid isomerase-like protein